MSTAKPHLAEVSAVPNQAASGPAGFRIFSRILDWITSERMQLINITDRINEIVRKSGVKDGLVHLQSLHTTTALFINEWQDALLHDIRTVLGEIIRRDADWRHNNPAHSDCERQNADSHLRGMLLGQSLCLQVRNSCVLLGTWQSIILAELDGPRSRSLSVQVSGI
ncbi:MAG: YjbQ family protein [Bryobacterales bacterium]|nr:YjbQ family protein [Bryobacterales bacterium]